MKKRLDTNAVMNELRGASVFFPTPTETENGTRNPTVKFETQEKQQPSRLQTSEPASTLAREQDRLLEEIRRTVKGQGKEVSYVRLTLEEKNQLADIIYSYKRQGVRTTETEISRIAINYLIEDYQANGQASILARLLVLLTT